MLQNLIDRFLPDEQMVFSAAGPLLVLTLMAAGLSGWLKLKKGWPTPYTRKVFHFFIFSAAGLLQFFFGLKLAVFFGMIVFATVMIAVAGGEKIWLYQALARETDAPHEKKFIMLPLFATAAGGVLSNLLFPTTAFMGYFVAGWGDAVGEPAGTRWGRHRYAVPTLFGVRASRSLEGSLAVMLVSSLATFLFLFFVYSLSLPHTLALALTCGLAAAIVEAFSSHGLDNFTIQLVAAGLLHVFLR